MDVLTRWRNPFQCMCVHILNHHSAHFKYLTILYFHKGEILKRKAKQDKGKQSWKVLLRKDGQEALSM